MTEHPGPEPTAPPDHHRPTAHGSFSIERVFTASPHRIFQAFVDPASKALWFGSDDRHTVLERLIDVWAGGRERLRASLES